MGLDSEPCTLIEMNQLEYLNMSYNKLGEKLASIIVNSSFGLTRGRSIESLFLVETDIDDNFI